MLIQELKLKILYSITVSTVMGQYFCKIPAACSKQHNDYQARKLNIYLNMTKDSLKLQALHSNNWQPTATITYQCSTTTTYHSVFSSN
jgi:hypothetical protein